jgi:hypothetical protein
MKQLRNMINSDFDNMVDFGKKVCSKSQLCSGCSLEQIWLILCVGLNRI